MCDKRNNFCYVCGLLVDKNHRFELRTNKTVVEAFNLFSKCSYVESAWYEPEYICSVCCTTLKKWKTGKCDDLRLPFVTPMVWHYQIYHKPEDCYFCQTKITGHHHKTRHLIKYADVLTVSKPVARGEQDQSTTGKNPANFPESSNEPTDEGNDEPYIPTGAIGAERHFVSNQDYRDLVRDLELSLRQTEILASRLKQWNIVDSDFKVTSARDRDLSSFEQIFEFDDTDNNLVYCVDVDTLFDALDHKHCPQDWRLFLDGSCKSEYLMCYEFMKTKLE